MTAIGRLTEWAHGLVPSAADVALAERSLRDAVAVALAATDHPVVGYAVELDRAGAWAVAAHVLDFDDVHIESTSHVSAVVVPAVVATGGDGQSYLAGAGVMARLGTMLGWPHYARGWHTTCTAGAPAAAVAAAVAMGLDEAQTAHALALAVPAAGGVQRAFGTDAKSLQVGMAADAGVRAARLAARGARGDLAVLDQWLELVGARSTVVDTEGPAVPGGLAIKLFPCGYAMQRPIHAVRAALEGEMPTAIEAVSVRTSKATVLPLTHHRPRTGSEGKFSLEYAVAVAALDGFPTLASFRTDGVRRPDAAAIMDAVSVDLVDGGEGLLDGTCEVVVRLRDGRSKRAVVDQPLGSPGYPLTSQDLEQKFAGCGAGVAEAVSALSWSNAAAVLDRVVRRRRVV